MATERSQAITVTRRMPTPPDECSAKSWAMRPSRGTAVLSERESTVNLGAVPEEKVTSKRDRR